ncbi:MAG: hypothetical protein AAF333_10935 [Planctomycetota bacterium]
MLQRLQVRLDKWERIDWDLWCVDGTTVQFSRFVVGGGKKEDPPSPRITC